MVESVKKAHETKDNSRVIPGTPKDMGPPYGKRDPYYSHTTPIFESLKIWE